jgi:hypothetical protein
MKTLEYNPSWLEIVVAESIADLHNQIEPRLNGTTIIDVEPNLKLDNPRVKFVLRDPDGDKHTIIVQVIQRIDD